MLSRLLPCWWSSHALAPTHVLTGRRSIEGEDGCMHHDSMRTFYCALEEEDSMFRGTILQTLFPRVATDRPMRKIGYPSTSGAV
ncbi:hypothetical protein SETIT_8G135300v2 [Setaria italica]|uniref:Uncharacterized protein n=1 Tax=Setaria italica TaxID=4555 RepID=A0A368S914_SETIT|nr:hypothetical protein SETIT_8G135300v2 [Setaria italica]